MIGIADVLDASILIADRQEAIVRVLEQILR